MVEVHVPLEFVGVSPAVKELGGTLVKVLHEINIEALPKDLPHDLTVDISTLAGLDDKILVQDIPLPPGVTLNREADNMSFSLRLKKTPKEQIIFRYPLAAALAKTHYGQKAAPPVSKIARSRPRERHVDCTCSLPCFTSQRRDHIDAAEGVRHGLRRG
jgi:large subunit ribosomal protein L25